MAAEIDRELGLEAELIRGSGGVFDVHADGDLVYSKYVTGTFPAEDHVLEALKKRS